MGNPAVDRTKREMALKALTKLSLGGTMTRAQIFEGYDEFKDLQKRVLATLKSVGAIKRIGTSNPAVVLFSANNPDMLRSIARSESEVTRLIWPSAAPLVSEVQPQPEVQEPEEEPEVEELTEVPATTPSFAPPPPKPQQAEVDDESVRETVKKILDRQDLILEKVIDPIVENVIWTRDRVKEIQETQKELTKAVEGILVILRKLE